MAPMNEAKRALLTEGLTSYPEALVALREFQHEIQGRCQEVLKRYLPALCQAMGCQGEPKPVGPYTYPPNLFRGTLSDAIWLGAQWKVNGDLTCLVCLEWWKEDDTSIECAAVAAFEPYNALLSILSQKFEEQRASDWDGIEIRESVSPKDPEACFIKLDEMMHTWVDLWSNAGTLNTMMPDRS
jgi:hypothetical protein